MPYICYPANLEPSADTAIASFRGKSDAIAFLQSRTDRLSVAFDPLPADIRHWHDRETDRFTSGEYVRVPWESAYHAGGHLAAYACHFAHMSVETPGHVAYTPDNTYGHENRKKSVRPGRYLAQFAPDLSDADRERFTAACTGLISGDQFRLARTASEITTVCENGPASCMGPNHTYDSDPVHPMAVYADSPDLALAYLGPLTKATARAVVWPDRQLFTVVYPTYGTGTEHAERLRTALCAAGYTYSRELAGARIRKIEHDDDTYVMAYVDAATWIGHDTDRRYWVLNGGRRTDYDVKVQTGVTGDTSTCENCNDRCPTGEAYCESCENDRWSCERCGDSSFNIDDSVLVADMYYCEHCADRYSWRCDGCGDRGLVRDGGYASVGDETVCDTCLERQYSYCDTCEAYYRPTRTNPDCPDCPEPDPDSDDDRAESDDRADYDRLMAVNPCVPFVLIAPDTRETRVPLEVLASYGPFRIHETFRSHGYTVTHVGTGLSITQELANLATAVDLMRRLVVPGIDWNFTDRDTVPAETLNHGRTTLAATIR